MPLLAYDYPLLGLFWSFLMFFLWIIWIWILISILIDVFRSHDLNGFMKALWLLFIVFIPVVGVIVYLIARGHKMQEHTVESIQKQNDMFKDFAVSSATSGGSAADELTKLAGLRDSGVLTNEEFEAQKARLLSP